MNTKIESCRFAFKCPKTWEDLHATNVDTIRYCDKCFRNVYLTADPADIARRAAVGHCVAIPIDLKDPARDPLVRETYWVGGLTRKPTTSAMRAALVEGNAGFDLPYVGIDGCRGGWFYFAVDREDSVRFGVISGFEEVAQFLDAARLVLVDIPIGLPSATIPNRLCDTQARRAIQPRGSSVFPAPARSAIEMPDYRQGSAENQRCLGRKLSTQSWAISRKIHEVDEFMRAQRPPTVREMHPEVAFWALNGRQPLEHGKKFLEGERERLEVLAEIGHDGDGFAYDNEGPRHFHLASDSFDEARQAFLKKDVASDDIIDAMVGAVTARYSPRLATLPESPLRDDLGLPMEMVYADL